MNTRESARKWQCKDTVGLLCTDDHNLKHRKLEILIIYKQTREFHIINVACSFKTRVKKKKQKKVEKYHELKREIGRLW